MDTKNNIVEDAVDKLHEITGLNLFYADVTSKKNSIATIENERFAVEVKSEITQGNQGVVLQQLKEISRKKQTSVLLLTKYIPSLIAKHYVAEGINYLDTAGNCFIRQGALCLMVEGKKTERKLRVNQPRAFQETGIKLLYQLLWDLENMNKPVSELAALAQISVGSVSTIFQELTDLQFVLRTNKQKVLKNKPELLERWVMAYHDVLRPRLIVKQMNFAHPKDAAHWEHLPLKHISEKTIWGGECAAALSTRYLTPAKYTIYTDAPWQTLGKTLKLVPDGAGRIEIVRLFYKASEADTTVSPLLTYADLMGSGDSRNMETAKKILNHDLRHLK